MDPSVKRNLIKAGIFAGVAWIGYSIIKGISKNQSVETIVKESVAPAIAVTEGASQVVKKAAKFLKGSPEAKEYMKNLREKAKSKKKPATDSEVIKENKLEGKEAEKVKEGLPEVKKENNHKGHDTKRGLAQDQKLISKEKHEKAYQKKKGK
jgi:hypothetical protein